MRAAINDGDTVGVAHGGEPMRDDQDRAAGHQPLERELDHALALRIERARRLVEQQDRPVGAGSRAQSQGAAAVRPKAHAALAEEARIALRQRADEFGRVRRFARRVALGVARIRPPVANVLETLVAKITGSCGTSARRARTVVRIGSLQIDAVDAHRPRLRIVEAQQQLKHRRLAGARRSDQRDLFAGGDVERSASSAALSGRDG